MSNGAFLPAERAATDAEIDRSFNALRRAETVVQALVDVDAFSHATLFAEVAAQRATFAHAGVFVSPAIEHALARAARRIELAGARNIARSRRATPQRVLHIATGIEYPEGGHGRVIERWIRTDASRAHSVVTTYPRHEVPAFLRETVAATGGATHRLAPGSASFVERARHLRALASEADAIVLHTHTYDALPTLALSWPGRPPTIFSNHASHIFWLGRSISDVIVCGREVTKELCVSRRRVPPGACFVMPLPPAEAPREPVTQSRADIRRELEVSPDDVLLLTIASEFKFRTAGVHDLLQTVSNVIHQQTGIAWRIVGARPRGRWAALANETDGRIRALGIRNDLRNLYSAADAYIDSYPFGSRTAMLDAAATGLPLLAPRWHPQEAAVLSPWGGAVDSAINGFDDEASLAARLSVLAVDANRRKLGAAALAAVTPSLVGPGWAAAIERAYDLAAARTELRDADGAPPHEPDSHAPPDDLDRYLRHLYSSTEPERVLINWHREETNWGAESAYPGDEAWLAETAGLAAVIGEQDLIIRDLEACTTQLRQTVAAAEGELKTLRAALMRLQSEVTS